MLNYAFTNSSIGCVLFLSTCISGELPQESVSSVHTVSTEISNQQINCISEDAQGHIWIGTARGANKHNVYEFQQYFYSSRDSLSISGNQVQHMLRDSRNRLWFATTTGVSQYTDKDCFKRIPIEANSQNAIQLLEDNKGRIFLNMVIHFCEFDEKQQKFITVFPNFDNEVKWNNSCFIDKSGFLWVVSGNVIRCYNLDTKELIKRIVTDNFYHYSFLRENGELWLASVKKLSILDTESGNFKEIPDAIRERHIHDGSIITNIHSYSNAALLIGTRSGLFLYNYISEKVIHQSEEGFPFQAPTFNITSMFTDSQKNLWIGSAEQGFVTIFNYQQRFNSNNFIVSRFEGKSVTSITKDHSDNLWITTSLGEVYLYQPENKSIQAIDASAFFPRDEFFKINVNRIFIDDDNFIWLISEIGSLVKCKYSSNKLSPVRTYSLSSNVSCMTQDKAGNLYAIGFNENINILNKGESEFKPKPIYPSEFVFTNGMITLSTGEVLVASFNQDMRLINPVNGLIEKIEIVNCLTEGVFVPTVLMEDSGGDIWIGTYFNGLLHYSVKSKTITTVEGTSCNDITGLQQDIQGNIWISTLFGLSKYDRVGNKVINYYKSDGIGGNQFNERSNCQLKDGTLIFGGTHGLTFFNPLTISIKSDLTLLFENLKVHNQLVSPNNSRIIDKHISYNPDVRLKNRDNSFTISFTALDYSEFERVHYYYYLEGHDKYWVDAGNYHEAFYSNVPPGKYTFRVRITNKDKTITEAENSLSIRILPASALSWWAYLLYLAFFGLIIFYIGRLLYRIRKDKEEVALIERAKEQQEEINKVNMSFFSNISHELRTPLTMISGPVAQLCADSTINNENKNLLFIIQRSVNRMLKLVNQVMDFNKMENDTLKLSVKRTDVISELNRIMGIFILNAKIKGISLVTYGLEDSYFMLLDADKLDHILGNLISNAVKFTDPGGKISIKFDVIGRKDASELFKLRDNDISSQYVKISVSDTGKGIPEAKLERIFERYYQVEQNKGVINWGTGIGLYYARRLAELHHGYINASNLENGGSLLTLLLSADEDSYSAEERNAPVEEQKFMYPIVTDEQYRSRKPENTGNESIKIMVIDDDSEILNYLNALISPQYNVVSSYSAVDALKRVEEEAPDLIICDVVMPDMSGYDFCGTIKNDVHLCHIPVVLVTAKTTVESQVEGLNTGADAYVNKPFDPAYLMALIKSQLKNRENIRKLLGTETKIEKIENNLLSPHDNAFMTKLYEIMESELSNSELNINRMTEILKISRTKLYYKIKGLTGINPNTFFKMYKLNRATELLAEGKYNISEIADITGFSTLSHFSTSFKKQFGVSPSEYKIG